MKTHLSTWYFAALAWLASSVLALAQPVSGPQSPTSLYGTSPSSPPNAFNAQRSGPTPVAPISGGNNTAGSTVNGALTAQGAGLTSGSATPAGSEAGNVNAPASLPGAAGPRPVAPSDLSQAAIIMPNSMDMIDNQHKLVPSDRFNLQIREDNDPAVTLLVDESGNVDFPYLGRRNVNGLTLREMANNVKTGLLEGIPATATSSAIPSYYKHATVLAALDKGDHSRGQIYVVDQFIRPGSIVVPTNKILTLWDVVTQAGGFTPLADQTQVMLIHHDPADPTNPEKTTKTVIDWQKSMANGNPPSNVVQAEDFVVVPSKIATTHYYTVSGEVRAPGYYQLVSEPPTTISRAIQAAGGFTDWAKEDKVVLKRKTNGKVTEQIVDVGSILKDGHVENDMLIQPDDVIWVDWKLAKFN